MSRALRRVRRSVTLGPLGEVAAHAGSAAERVFSRRGSAAHGTTTTATGGGAGRLGNGGAALVTRGEAWLWPTNGTMLVSQSYVDAVPDTRYRIVGNGDYDGDGQADTLWHHATRGEVSCRGSNAGGQLGGGTITERIVPTMSDISIGFVSLAAG